MAIKLDALVSIVVVGGSGVIGVRHLQHIAKSTSATLFGIIDPSPAAVDIAQVHSTVLFSSIQEMLTGNIRPDAAIVCTPNDTHVPLAVELVQAGIHVLVEKPISVSVASARSLLEAAKAHNVQILVGHHRRFNSYVVTAKRLIDSGLLGEITAVSALWTAFKPPSYFEPGALRWRGSKENGGGVVLINMIHEIDLMHYFFGPVTRVHAEKTISRRGHTAEEGAAITLRFASGVVGTFVISDHVTSPYHFESGTGENPMMPKSGTDVYRIFGTAGTLSFPDMIKWTYDGRPPSWELELSGERVDVPDKTVAPFDRQLDHFIKVVKGLVPPRCSGEDGLLALEVCEAIREALHSESGTVEIGKRSSKL